MPVITVGTENSGPIDLHYEDYGSGRPVILIHGYPLSGLAWDKQIPPLLEAGHRVITYDRRGSGASSQPATGYDWDTFTADLDTLINTLGLDQVTLVGHRMGTGEVTRYLSTFGSEKIDRAVLIGPIPPYLSQAPDNPDGVPANLFDGFRQQGRPSPPTNALQPGSPTSGLTFQRSISRYWSSRATRTGSCRSTRPASGCPG